MINATVWTREKVSDRLYGESAAIDLEADNISKLESAKDPSIPEDAAPITPKASIFFKVLIGRNAVYQNENKTTGICLESCNTHSLNELKTNDDNFCLSRGTTNPSARDCPR